MILGPPRATPLSCPARARELRRPRSAIAGRVSCSGWFGRDLALCQLVRDASDVANQIAEFVEGQLGPIGI
jgi:hypothetical protein